MIINMPLTVNKIKVAPAVMVDGVPLPNMGISNHRDDKLSEEELRRRVASNMQLEGFNSETALDAAMSLFEREEETDIPQLDRAFLKEMLEQDSDNEEK